MCDYNFTSINNFLTTYVFWVTIPSPQFLLYPNCLNCDYKTSLYIDWEKEENGKKEKENQIFDLCDLNDNTTTCLVSVMKNNHQMNFSLGFNGSDGLFNIKTKSDFPTKYTPDKYTVKVVDPFNVSWCQNTIPQSVSTQLANFTNPNSSCIQTNNELEIINGKAVLNIPNMLVETTSYGKINLNIESDIPIICSLTIQSANLQNDRQVVSRGQCSFHTIWTELSLTSNKDTEGGTNGNSNYKFSLKLTVWGLTAPINPKLIYYTLQVKNSSPYYCQVYKNISYKAFPISKAPTNQTKPQQIILNKHAANHYIYPKNFHILKAHDILHTGIYEEQNMTFTCKLKFVKNETTNNIITPTSNCPQNVCIEWTKFGEIIFKFLRITKPFPTYIAFILSPNHQELYKFSFINIEDVKTTTKITPHSKFSLPPTPNPTPTKHLQKHSPKHTLKSSTEPSQKLSPKSSPKSLSKPSIKPPALKTLLTALKNSKVPLDPTFKPTKVPFMLLHESMKSILIKNYILLVCGSIVVSVCLIILCCLCERPIKTF
nr:homolog of Bovine herpesvirus 6 Bov8 putative major envelope glycoprotein and RGHV1 ORF18 glycoprotein [Macronycteris gammaherpesvirus 1]